MTPTPTPRVDAAIERWKNRPWAGSPTDRPLMLARELERELANIKAERDALRAEVEKWKKYQENTQYLWLEDVKRLRARVAELEADKARLDWLEEQSALVESDNGHQWQSWEVTMDPPAHCDVRQAIDAARGKGAT